MTMYENFYYKDYNIIKEKNRNYNTNKFFLDKFISAIVFFPSFSTLFY